MSAQDLSDLEAFLDTLTDADVVNQVNAPQAVPALGANASRMLLTTLLATGLSFAGRRGRRVPVRNHTDSNTPRRRGRSPRDNRREGSR
jgi:hypothetical protein